MYPVIRNQKNTVRPRGMDAAAGKVLQIHGRYMHATLTKPNRWLRMPFLRVPIRTLHGHSL